MLHILNHYPSIEYLKNILNIMHYPEDEIILLSIEVILGIHNNFTILSKILNNTDFTIYALENNILSRGLISYIKKNITIIDYKKFIQLTEKHSQQIHW